MKNKFGFNIIFPLLAFPIALKLYKDIDFSKLSFKNPILDLLYLTALIGLVFLTMKSMKENK